jgi:hypothetical protein
MKKILLILTLSFLCFCQVDAQWINGSGKVLKEDRKLSGFHAIHARLGVDVYISKGSAETVSVEADDNLLSMIKTEVNNGVLEVWHEKSFMRTTKMRVYVTVKDLDYIEANGGSDVYSENMLELSKLVCHATGGSDIKLQVSATSLELHLEGGSDALLSGKAATFIAHAEGGSDIKASDLTSGDCEVYASGGSDAHVHAEKNIKIKAKGGSDVYYTGKPQVINTDASGGSDIHPRN